MISILDYRKAIKIYFTKDKSKLLIYLWLFTDAAKKKDILILKYVF